MITTDRLEVIRERLKKIYPSLDREQLDRIADMILQLEQAPVEVERVRHFGVLD